VPKFAVKETASPNVSSAPEKSANSPVFVAAGRRCRLRRPSPTGRSALTTGVASTTLSTNVSKLDATVLVKVSVNVIAEEIVTTLVVSSVSTAKIVTVAPPSICSSPVGKSSFHVTGVGAGRRDAAGEHGEADAFTRGGVPGSREVPRTEPLVRRQASFRHSHHRCVDIHNRARLVQRAG